MIKRKNGLGGVSISGKYIVSLIKEQLGGCSGVTKINRVEVSRSKKGGDNVDVRIFVSVSPYVAVPAVCRNIIREMSYALETKAGVKPGSIKIYVG